MKKFIMHFVIIVIYASISACSSATPFSFIDITPSTPITNTPIPSVTSLPSPTPSTPHVPALVKTTLEFYRNGKTYEIIVGYSVGDAFFYATPRAEVPQEKEEQANRAELERYGDIDNDGETEFIVSLMYCGTYCSETIQIYEFDVEKDLYYVADEFGAKFPAVDKYADINADGSLEIITANYGFCFQCGGASAALATFSVLRYENGKFVEVTTEFPELIQQDADLDLKSAKADEQHAAIITLPSYLYNMYRLGKMDEARSVFDEVCNTVVKPSIGCAEFLNSVERYIEEFEANKQVSRP